MLLHSCEKSQRVDFSRPVDFRVWGLGFKPFSPRTTTDSLFLFCFFVCEIRSREKLQTGVLITFERLLKIRDSRIDAEYFHRGSDSVPDRLCPALC
jgi:hypothetical protein